MALYWPNEKVALDIVDDPYRNPFEGDDSYTVLRVTCADLCDYDSYRKVMGRLCELLGREAPSMPGWEEGNRKLHSELFEHMEEYGYGFTDSVGLGNPYMCCGGCEAPITISCDEESAGDSAIETDADLPDNIEIIATSKDEGRRMRAAASEAGQHVRGVSIWDGPVPSGSFETISGTTRMSTPEYFFLRKANQLPFVQAVAMGVELCGKYRTKLTQYNREDDYDFLKYARTTKSRLRRYLREIRSTKEGKRAKRILRHVPEECGSPMACYLHLLLCLPRAHGSYGLPRIKTWGAYKDEHGFLPASSGDYLVYDLFWENERVAVQYTGTGYPSQRDFAALATEDVRVVCLSDEDVADPERFHAKAQEVARLLGEELPEPTDKWTKARDRLRTQVEMPTFDHMRMTMSDLAEHRVA